MWATREGSTGRLIQLCIGYFVFYVVTGVSVKYFLGSAADGFPGMSSMAYLVYSTAGGNLICLATVLALGWWRYRPENRVAVGPLRIPAELLFIIPSGFCAAVVIPTTTLMYSLPISVMVAMVIMRGAVIIISRIVDTIQIHQGILTKRVLWEENIAVAFALAAIGLKIFWSPQAGGFEFLHSTAAMTILGSYLAAYALRIYIMNYYKNTRTESGKLDNRVFFAIEQIAASVFLVLAAILVFNSPRLFGWGSAQLSAYREAFITPHHQWGWAVICGTAFGIVAFFSVFIFMFKGRTATFAGLVNRLTSLIAGTSATLISYFFLGGRFPKAEDWLSLLFIFVAVGFLTRAERRRVRLTEPALQVRPA